MKLTFFLITTLVASIAFADEQPQPTPAPTPNHVEPAEEKQSTETPQADEPSPKIKRGRFYLGIGYNSGTSMKFNSVTLSGGTNATGTTEIQTDTALTLQIGGEYLPENAWGFLGGLTIQGKRNINTEIDVFNNSTTTTNYSAKPTIQMNFLEFSAAYRWNEFYLPFGLNYSIGSVVTSSSGSNFTTAGAIGAQLGVGYCLNEHARIELYSYAMALGLSAATATTNISFGTGYMPSAEVRFRYGF